MIHNFKDKVILVTGANRGIGRSLVQTLLNIGVGKIYAACRDISKMPAFDDNRITVLENFIIFNKPSALLIMQEG